MLSESEHLSFNYLLCSTGVSTPQELDFACGHLQWFTCHISNVTLFQGHFDGILALKGLTNRRAYTQKCSLIRCWPMIVTEWVSSGMQRRRLTCWSAWIRVQSTGRAREGLVPGSSSSSSPGNNPSKSLHCFSIVSLQKGILNEWV